MSSPLFPRAYLTMRPIFVVNRTCQLNLRPFSLHSAIASPDKVTNSDRLAFSRSNYSNMRIWLLRTYRKFQLAQHGGHR
ncbi:hypothetical protein MPTK1_5g16760 [Marchantia polymorpha subsp. ruderalis]|uniref:Uncharacterized protein n=2 Tax=Marchantia polymorpha TaxID=3197 RepID=A0AAF6BJ28_MARPO|nr:hypothetical protein MARPO_0117s0030 [Marchantia polymorpha]BBN12012.1 hypothetical protein Mp_5g16760 [Marchantia polymorpha subsp. ruderalis]|eukprot:PTQ30971.1 hypothetical protein MARPO_0117s0030 [Marchantia polymorpha]